MSFKYFGLILLGCSLTACVSTKKFNASQAALHLCKKENDSLQADVIHSQYEKMNSLERADEASALNAMLTKDSIMCHTQLEKANKELQDLKIEYNKLVEEKKILINNSSARSEKLSEDLLQKQNLLEEKERMLENKELSNTALTNELRLRMNRVKELEHILQTKDSSTIALKNRISAALQSFDNSELTVTRKNGKVYVSIADKLLFKPGSTMVDNAGKEALKKLAEVLEKNADINITVEGHTDNTKFNHETYPKNNWDLSVLRATTIVKILQSQNIDASRIIASGRAEYSPLVENTSKENKAQNRRTEIILTPKLDELIKILETN